MDKIPYQYVHQARFCQDHHHLRSPSSIWILYSDHEPWSDLFSEGHIHSSSWWWQQLLVEVFITFASRRFFIWHEENPVVLFLTWFSILDLLHLLFFVLSASMKMVLYSLMAVCHPFLILGAFFNSFFLLSRSSSVTRTRWWYVLCCWSYLFAGTARVITISF